MQQYELRVKRLDAEFGERVKALFEAAAAAPGDPETYWVQGVLAYFGAAGPERTRGRLKATDPNLYALVHETFAYEGHPDWRFRRSDLFHSYVPLVLLPQCNSLHARAANPK